MGNRRKQDRRNEQHSHNCISGVVNQSDQYNIIELIMRVRRSLVEFQSAVTKGKVLRNIRNSVKGDAIVAELVTLIRKHKQTPAVQQEAKHFINFLNGAKNIQEENTEPVERKDERTFLKSDIVFSDAKQTSPPPTLNTKTTSVAESRTFIGQYRKYWSVGAKVDLKHDGDWLSGTVIAANLSAARDVYDIKLDNGAVVLDVSSENLRSTEVSLPLLDFLLTTSPLWFLAYCVYG